MDKKILLISGIIVIAICLTIRLFYLQIVDSRYKINAENNALSYQTKYPARGEIKDRNGNTLVGNKTTYDIMITPIDVKEFDTIDFCNTFHLDYQTIVKKLENYRQNRRKIGYQSFTFIKQVSAKDYNLFAEKAYKFPGFYAISRTARILKPAARRKIISHNFSLIFMFLLYKTFVNFLRRFCKVFRTKK